MALRDPELFVVCFWPHGVIAVQGKQDTAVMLGCSSVEISWMVFCETVVSWMALSFTERKWFLPPLSKTQNVPLLLLFVVTHLLL